MFVLLKDLVNDKEMIINNYPLQPSQIPTFFKDFCEKLVQKETHLEGYIIHEDYCEVYQNKEEVSKGWVWNSKHTQKMIVYILRLVPLYDHSGNDTSKVDVSVQTWLNQSDISNMIIDHSESAPFSEDNDNGNGNSTCNCADISLPRSEPEHFSNTHIIFGTGYANSILFPQLHNQLTIELKSKLASPNFGLKSII